MTNILYNVKERTIPKTFFLYATYRYRCEMKISKENEVLKLCLLFLA